MFASQFSMVRRNRNELLCSGRSTNKRIQKQVVHSKRLKENICKICKKQQTLGVCFGKHKHNVHNQSLKTNKCITCGKQFIKRKSFPALRTSTDDHVAAPKVVRTVNCLACRKKRLTKEKLIMKKKIMKLVRKTEVLLRKCASATNTETMVDFLQTVQVRLGVLRQNLNVLNAVNAL